MRPTVKEVLRFGQYVIGGKRVNFEEVHRCLQFRDFIIQLLDTGIKGLKHTRELVARQAFFGVEPIDPVDFFLRLVAFGLAAGEQSFLGLECFVGFGDVAGDFFGGQKVAFELFQKDAFEVHDGYLVPAFFAAIFRRIGHHIHLVSTFAVNICVAINSVSCFILKSAVEVQPEGEGEG